MAANMNGSGYDSDDENENREFTKALSTRELRLKANEFLQDIEKDAPLVFITHHLQVNLKTFQSFLLKL